VSRGTQVRIRLVDRFDHHTVNTCIAADGAAADAMIHAWLALGSSQIGDTEVVVRVVGHPARLPEVT